MTRKATIATLVFLEAASPVSIALAQSPGTFTDTGNMTMPRSFHTATLLPNGKVLIAGGAASPSTPSAELYDPSTGTFKATGDMTRPRAYHTATLLPNGKVLIADGTSAELYDPSTGTFTATGDMNAPLAGGGTATLLPDGKVLLVGIGPRSTANSILTRVTLYDPSTESFTLVREATEVGIVSDITATLLANGKALVTKKGQSELYDPATGVFTRTADFALADQGFLPTETLLGNGKVLIAGGDVGEGYGTARAELYDPETGVFTAIQDMPASEDSAEGATATLLPDGKVLIAGFDYPDYSTLFGHTAELYDAATGTFSVTGDMHAARGQGFTATLLPDGTVLIAGGFVCCGQVISAAEIYHPATLVPSPVLFSLSGDGQGQGAILHADTQQVVSASNPAMAGEAVEIYGTGLIDRGVIPPQVVIGGQLAEVLFFGNAPGYEGLNQINVRVPSGTAAGPAIPVRLNYLQRPSNEVTIGVR